jgi:bifunctional DNA-binding transcriptional regulator/antitoxin component of YhaV-PrlF toxin-antitoxin module
MTHIRLRPKHQVTLPASIVRQAKIKADDTLSVVYLNGSIVITPTRPKPKGADLMSFAGIGRGLWGDSPSAVDATLRSMKDAWER